MCMHCTGMKNGGKKTCSDTPGFWPPPELRNYFFFKRIMTLHLGNSCSLFEKWSSSNKKSALTLLPNDFMSCKLMFFGSTWHLINIFERFIWVDKFSRKKVQNIVIKT